MHGVNLVNMQLTGLSKWRNPAQAMKQIVGAEGSCHDDTSTTGCMLC